MGLLLFEVEALQPSAVLLLQLYQVAVQYVAARGLLSLIISIQRTLGALLSRPHIKNSLKM